MWISSINTIAGNSAAGNGGLVSLSHWQQCQRKSLQQYHPGGIHCADWWRYICCLTGSVINAYNNNFDPANVSGSLTNSGNNIDQDPTFADPVNGDYHLLAGASLRHGNNAAPSLPSNDFEGNNRIVGIAVTGLGADEIFCEHEFRQLHCTPAAGHERFGFSRCQADPLSTETRAYFNLTPANFYGLDTATVGGSCPAASGCQPVHHRRHYRRLRCSVQRSTANAAAANSTTRVTLQPASNLCAAGTPSTVRAS